MRKHLFAVATLGLVTLLSSLSLQAGAAAVPVRDPADSAFAGLLAQQVRPGSLPLVPQADGSFLLDNPLQDVQARIASTGTVFSSTSDEEGKGSFTLDLVQWGRDGAQRAVVAGSLRHAAGQVVHSHPDGLAEAFTNTANGIRQDFIVATKPAGTGPLALSLALTGAVARVTESGVQLTLDGSGRVLTYDRLQVTDAGNRVIPASMQLAANRELRIVVDDSAAEYPLTIDPTVGDANWTSMGGFAGTNDAAGEIKAVLRHGTDIYVAGNFTVMGSVQANYIARWDGSAWNPLGNGTDGVINALAVDAGGNLYAGGHFSTAGGVPVADIARWDGSAWSALGTGTSGDVLALVVDGSGTLYAGGTFVTAGGLTVNNLASWDGATWSPLGNGTDGTVQALALDGSGNLYAGGQFTHAGGLAASNIARWDGAAWTALGAGTAGSVLALVVDGSGRVYAGGQFVDAGGVPAPYIASWDGSVWNSLDAGMDGEVRALLLDGSGNLYAGGLFSIAGAVLASSVAVWNGSAWAAVAADTFDGAINALALDGSGQLLAGGVFDTIGTTAVNGLARWDGVAWSRMNGGSSIGLSGSVFTMLLDGSGNLYAGGVFTRAGGIDVNYIARWDGSAWSALGSGMNGAVYALAVDGSGTLYAGGSFTTAGGVAANYIARWDGTAWSAVGSGVDSVVQTLVVDSHGVLYAGGQFTHAGDIETKRIARWDGSVWSPMGLGMNNTVLQLALSSSGTLYAGGRFSLADNTVVNYIAKWNSNAWVPLGSGVNDAVQALALDGAGNVYIGGLFTQAGSTIVNRIARWNGSDWSALGNGMNDAVYALVALDGGIVYAAGRFSQAGSTVVSRLANWNGSDWVGQGSGANGVVQTLVTDGQGTLFAGGQFSVAGGKVSTFVARWFMDSDADGVGDLTDNCPAVFNPGQLNTDGDVPGDACDAFPTAAGETRDTDGDGIGDMADTDDDGDGVADASDPFPLDPAESADTDGDGVGNNADGDDDNDGVADGKDAFPLDPAETKDTDGDGIGNVADMDDDGDGVADSSDPFPLNGTEWLDSDGDGKGNNADTDDDNDGFADSNDAFPLDATETFDSDADGTGNNKDNCVFYANADQRDGDADSLGDACDAFPADNLLQLQKNGEVTREGLGASVAFADMNADGITDLLVGAPQATVSVAGKPLKKAGLIRIISGSSNTVLRSLQGTAANQQFGAAMTVVNDRNSDGVPDVVVGEPAATVTTQSGSKTVKLKGAGRVALYSGADGTLLSVLVEGSHAGDALGAAVKTGQANADGIADLVVGVPRADAGGKDAGQVLVFDGLSKTLLYSRQGTQAGELFGAAIAIDGENLFVGAPAHDTATAANAGRVSAFSIKGDGTSPALLDVDGAIKSDAFGTAVGAASGRWAASAPFADSTGKDAGMVQVFKGLVATPVATLSGEAAGENFGSALSMAGDINRDGVRDIAIGTAKHDVSTTSNGKAVILKDAGGVEVLSGGLLIP